MIKKSFILFLIISVLFITYSYKKVIVINLLSIINGMTNHIEDTKPTEWTKNPNYKKRYCKFSKTKNFKNRAQDLSENYK